MPPHTHTHRSKSVSVERAVGAGSGGRLGNSDEGGNKDIQNDSGISLIVAVKYRMKRMIQFNVRI